MHINKEHAYSNLVIRVRQSYPFYRESEYDEGLRLYWFNDCEEINLWTYWQGRGNLDAQIMLVGQDWGCPWDPNYQPTIEQVRKANQNDEFNDLNNNPTKSALKKRSASWT